MDLCGVPEARIGTVTTHAGEAIHTYLNAGCFVVDRRRGLLTEWNRRFGVVPGDPVLSEWCRDSEAHAVFVHQAIFTGVMLAALSPDEMLELGPEYNYPAHLHEEIPGERRPASLEELVTGESLTGPSATVPPRETRIFVAK